MSVKKKLFLGLFFAFINFGGLALGAYLMNDGPQTSWYQDLNKAPWTPPGWVFGFAWTTIMLFFTIYLVELFQNLTNQKIYLYILQVFLNVSWNFVFFNQHQVALGLVFILTLTALIFYFFFTFRGELKKLSYLLLPYIIWLCIASSLNMYVVVYN